MSALSLTIRHNRHIPLVVSARPLLAADRSADNQEYRATAGRQARNQLNEIFRLFRPPPLAAAGRRWPPLAAADRSAAAGRRWPPLAAAGRRWPLLAAAGRCWPLLAAAGRCWPPPPTARPLAAAADR